MLFPCCMALLMASPFFMACTQKETSKPSSSIDTMALLIHDIANSSRLYTTDYQVHKLITRNDVKELSLNVFSKDLTTTLPGHRKVAVPIIVHFKAYIDFSEFSEKNIKRTDSSLTVFLPEPHIIVAHSHIDHERVQQYVSLTRDRFTTSEITDLAAAGEREAISEIQQTGIFQSAKESAARTLLPLLQRLGYKDNQVRIVFRKDHWAPNELQRMITHTTD